MPFKEFLGILAEAVTAKAPKAMALHVEDGSVGELLLRWSGDYRIRWYEGERAGRTQYVDRRSATLTRMPDDFAFPESPKPGSPLHEDASRAGTKP